MNKKRSVFFSILFFCVFPQLQAQIDTIDIDEITISAGRISQTYKERTRVIKIITKQEIETAPVQSINELLEYSLNIDVRNRGTNDVQADVSIRGGSFDQCLILLNGISINDPQTGHHSMNIPVDITNISRIEILEGPGARAYGPNAFSGAINIITDEQYDKNQVIASIVAGQNEYYSASAAANLSTEKWSNTVSLSKKVSGGYIENTDFDITNYYLQSAYKLKNGKISAQAGHTDKAFGANSFYTASYPYQYEQVRTSFASLGIQSDFRKLKFQSDVYYRRNQDRFELYREGDNYYRWTENGLFISDTDTAFSFYKGHNYHLTHIGGVNLRLNFQSFLGKTSIGTNLSTDKIFSNSLGEAADTIKVPFEESGVFTKQKTRQNYGVFFEHGIKFNHFNLVAGLLANQNSEFGWGYYPGIDFSYHFADSKIFAGVNQSLRLPTYTDLYYNSPTIIGNKNLKAEKSITYEIGYSFNTTYIRNEISTYYREGTNIIDWVKYPSETQWQTQNYATLNTIGGKVETNFYPQELIPDFFIQRISAGYAYAEITKQSSADSLQSRYTLDYLAHKANVNLQHRIYGNFYAVWQVSTQDREGSYSDFVSGENVDYELFTLFDARIFWQKKMYFVYLEANNILDKKYYDLGNVVMPGRWGKIGLKIDLHWK